MTELSTLVRSSTPVTSCRSLAEQWNAVSEMTQFSVQFF